MTKTEFIQGYVASNLRGLAIVTLTEGEKELEAWRQELDRILNSPAA